MQTKKDRCLRICLFYGAGDEARTRYLHLGKVALYQMSYTRMNKVYYSKDSKFVKPYFLVFYFFIRQSFLSTHFPLPRHPVLSVSQRVLPQQPALSFLP